MKDSVGIKDGNHGFGCDKDHGFVIDPSYPGPRWIDPGNGGVGIEPEATDPFMDDDGMDIVHSVIDPFATSQHDDWIGI